MHAIKVVALAGGVGAARFLRGLVGVVDPCHVTAIVNTGDDFVHHGLHISPDLDTVTYTLAGLVNEKNGWGIAGDTNACLEMLGRLGQETWFWLGDRDIAVHLARTRLLGEGLPLSSITDRIRRALGVRARILPMTDAPFATVIETPEGALPFQDYFVRRGCRDPIHAIHFRGAGVARPAPGVLEAIDLAEAIVLCPSNPFVSIAPILAVPGIREAIERAPAPVAAVSPIVGGKALKGPADRMLRDLGHATTAVGVARLYEKLVDVFVLDTQDAALAPEVERLGMRCAAIDTIMSLPQRARDLARDVLGLLRR
jgi:LPPG:FO 2-phospho-L-lactate transferase